MRWIVFECVYGDVGCRMGCVGQREITRTHIMCQFPAVDTDCADEILALGGTALNVFVTQIVIAVLFSTLLAKLSSAMK